MTSLETQKKVKKALLKFNIDRLLKSNHDWKVVRAISTEQELEEEVSQYRAVLVSDYNARVSRINLATTKAELDAVSLVF